MSAAMKCTPFWWVQSFISSCFWIDAPHRTTTFGRDDIAEYMEQWLYTHLEALDQVDSNLLTSIAPKVPDRNVGVEFSQTRNGDLCTGLSNILLPQEELKQYKVLGCSNYEWGVVPGYSSLILGRVQGRKP